MKGLLTVGVLAGLLAFAAPQRAQAGVHVSVGVGLPVFGAVVAYPGYGYGYPGYGYPGYGYPAYYAPAPVYYAPVYPGRYYGHRGYHRSYYRGGHGHRHYRH